MRNVLLLICLGVMALVACSEDESTPMSNKTPSEVLVASRFDTDLDGWSDGTSTTNWGTVTWLSREGGIVKLDGVGFDGNPNAWISKEIALPADAKTLNTSTSAHDRGDGEVSLRIRIVDGSAVSHTILDWDPMKTGAEGFEFVPASYDISAYAGQTVTIFLEIGDIDGGGNNQRYIDYVDIRK